MVAALPLALALALGPMRVAKAQDAAEAPEPMTSIGEGGGEVSEEQEAQAYADQQTTRLRAERRGSVAAMGVFVALMSAIAVPVTYIPEGSAVLLRRLHVLHESTARRVRHRAYRARKRELPLIGMTALSVTALSSRFWWAGVLTASCGITSDVMLTEYWRRGGSTFRAVGIATATVGALAGFALDLETLSYSDVGRSLAFVPTLRLGVAQVELGLSGRF